MARSAWLGLASSSSPSMSFTSSRTAMIKRRRRRRRREGAMLCRFQRKGEMGMTRHCTAECTSPPRLKKKRWKEIVPCCRRGTVAAAAGPISLPFFVTAQTARVCHGQERTRGKGRSLTPKHTTIATGIRLRFLGLQWRASATCKYKTLSFHFNLYLSRVVFFLTKGASSGGNFNFRLS